MSKVSKELEIATHNQMLANVDIRFLKPLVLWYKVMDTSNLPPRVVNALDSLTAYFEGFEL